ncbi:MAG: 4-alpha-glucanotransferase [Deltaproteobacteria bacterium]|nr:4-alpha-glucanotransferase [Deltaproteobacteria bacterium]
MPEPVDAALARLGVRRLLLAIHDTSFPSDLDEDVGRGSPATRAAGRLLRYARSLGFTGIQLGPQGQTSRDNASPYDGTIFSRHLGTIALHSLREGGPFAGLVGERVLARALLDPGGGPARHRHAYDAMHALVDEAYFALRRRPDLAERLAGFRREHASWLDRDGLHAALCIERGTSSRHWAGLDARLWNPRPDEHAAAAARRAELATTHARAIERYAFGQLLAHDEHRRVRATCADLQLALYGDLQVGYADADAWANAASLLVGYVMGAPPSRTNPDGQPWNYPVLDPEKLGGAARAFVLARLDKAFAEYDSMRIDHPHGLVCPWVYRADTADPATAVREGARLFESPDLPDHPALARFAIARPDQLDRTLPRHHDHWVIELTPAQIDRYAVLFDAMAGSARRHGRAFSDLSCEVLSTMPRPLACVIARHHLGRWRVTQKANLDDPTDVYRTENAEPDDWVMIGNHDTAPIFSLIRGWSAAVRDKWARHLTQRLSLRRPERLAQPGFLATAMVAELFASRAENVSIFFADLFGYEDRFNAPGTYNDLNWTLRLPHDFDELHRTRLAANAAIDLALACELALAARP